MGSTNWHPFDGMACSEECGLKAQAAVQAVLDSREYVGLVDHLFEIKSRQSELVFKAIDGIYPDRERPASPFSFEFCVTTDEA